MVEEIATENGQISNFEGLVTLTLDRVILHTVVHQSSTSTYMTNFTEIEEAFCGRTDIHMHVCTHGWTFETSFIKSTVKESTEKGAQNSLQFWGPSTFLFV